MKANAIAERFDRDISRWGGSSTRLTLTVLLPYTPEAERVLGHLMRLKSFDITLPEAPKTAREDLRILMDLHPKPETWSEAQRADFAILVSKILAEGL